MKIGPFEIKCTDCGSENVRISTVHNDDEEWTRLTCADCKASEDL